ncbi:hypothetical protein ACH5RR_015276 [Cinchona calisaya]|uniref:Late endosomal/lysosomal adaptor and MAPK and MTOR activator 5 n=1 Tax=Cinchona calisaya TaxID=153742 RepID=A0ABD2ZVD6_9GENT
MKVEDAQEGLVERFREDLHKKNPWVTSIPHSPSTRKTLMAATILKEDEEDSTVAQETAIDAAAVESKNQSFAVAGIQELDAIVARAEREDISAAILVRDRGSSLVSLAAPTTVAATFDHRKEKN